MQNPNVRYNVKVPGKGWEKESEGIFRTLEEARALMRKLRQMYAHYDVEIHKEVFDYWRGSSRKMWVTDKVITNDPASDRKRASIPPRRR